MSPRSVVLAAALVGAACSDALERDTTAGQVIAVVNTTSNTLSLVDATSFRPGPVVDLAPPTGTPATLDARGTVIAIALGDADALRVVSSGTLPLSAPSTIALPVGSGATGVAIENDSIAWVANPNLNSVTAVNYVTGHTFTWGAGTYPQAVAVTESYVFVVNGNVTGGQPAGPSSLRWFGRGPGPVRPYGTIALSCTNARFAAVGSDGLLYVVCAGTVGAADGKLAIVDPVAGREVAVLNGLGESPGPAVYHPSGRLLVASTTEGILEVNTLTRTVTRGPGAGKKPGGVGIGALALDPRGRVYAVAAGACTSPGTVHILSGPPDYRPLGTVAVGVCPAAAALAALPPGP
jgi:streptogramin lyase